MGRWTVQLQPQPQPVLPGWWLVVGGCMLDEGGQLIAEWREETGPWQGQGQDL